ncbi:MAG: hypothetical protein G01um101448_616 [Parcubacteria group bacterium Gr01-1014_48]|nr:MAG: hypothetical protein Greene041614_456 [Parcubacteria group bacterium Greene0416_14]TSC73727.1 MAG: hypothetical protein G01um101448_616 [Parcubacteria group bacterium Gr01-1014_48]TSD00990.1 MAG: hypothetical protein Greene101415_563 [Parcubacteria group bacterium Greene1014_15]TSD08114.1 MAG: hypothetical protein Greene07144_398 [Parcubacteria group bacterium Greene0714_4]
MHHPRVEKEINSNVYTLYATADMCLAQGFLDPQGRMSPCDKPLAERGEGCEYAIARALQIAEKKEAKKKEEAMLIPLIRAYMLGHNVISMSAFTKKE